MDPLGKGGKLDEELKKVYVTAHKIKPIVREPEPIKAPRIGKGRKGAAIYTTIPEVIDAVNIHYEMALGNNERDLFEQYAKEIIKNPLIQNEIRANKVSDLNKLYKNKLSSVLKDKAINFFLTNNPDRLLRYIEKDILSGFNEEVFGLAVLEVYPKG